MIKTVEEPENSPVDFVGQSPKPVRSWANDNSKGIITSMYSHLNSHGSIVYYPDASCKSATSYSFSPEEDVCLIFPSSLTHSASPNTTDRPRISISMDGMFTLKKYQRDEPLLPPPETWKKIMS